MRLWRLSIAIAMMWGITQTVTAGKYSGGDGFYTPYQIADLDDWQELRDTPGDWGSNFALVADLNLAGIVYEQSPLAPDTDNLAGGHQGPRFTGALDGQGHAIINLTIDAADQDYVGLIGYIDGAGKVKNLTLESVSIHGRDTVGGLVGYAGGWGLLIENCGVSGAVQGGNEVGGLVGFHFSQGTIQHCSANVAVVGNDKVGGVIGVNHGGELAYGSSYGDVSGHNLVGGLVGDNPYPAISHSFARGNVSGNIEVGGLAGGNMGQISYSYATGRAEGNIRVAGLAGANRGAISICYAVGAAVGTEVVGGLVGFNDGPIANAYATGPAGSVSAQHRVGGLVGVNLNDISFTYSVGAVTAGGLYVGGLVGENTGGGVVSHSYWDTETSGWNDSAAGTGLPTGEMQDMRTFLDAGWDFVDETINGTDDIWTMSACTGYPVFPWEPLCNDLMGDALAITIGETIAASSVGATGEDITLMGYNDWADVWYYFDCPQTGKYTITVEPLDFDSTLAVFDTAGTEIIFNDDFFGNKSRVILKASAGRRYYIRVAGYDGQMGEFTLSLTSGAIPAIQGDLNYDGVVDMADFAIFVNQWLSGT